MTIQYVNAIFTKNHYLVITFEKNIFDTPNFAKRCLVTIVNYLQKEERKNRSIVAIFYLFFIIDDFCQPQLTNPSQLEHKSYFDRDFCLTSQAHI